MKRYSFLKPVIFSFALTLMLGVVSESRVFAQGPCPVNPNSSNLYVKVISIQILNVQSQGATVTCDSSNMYVQFPTGLYFRISVPQGYSVSMYAFDPSNGRSTTWYILGGADDEPVLLIQDSILGTINATDGWFSIFYPLGNPYSAEVQSPMQAMMMMTSNIATDPTLPPETPFRLQPTSPPNGN